MEAGVFLLAAFSLHSSHKGARAEVSLSRPHKRTVQEHKHS